MNVGEVPEPGMSSYALSLEFTGLNNINLVKSPITSATAAPDKISCSSRLLSTAATEHDVSNLLLNSGQGQFMLNSLETGQILSTLNSVQSPTSADYNFGTTGTPQVGSGAILDYFCFVGSSVPSGTHVTVTPRLLTGQSGAIFLFGQATPIIDVFEAGEISIGLPANQPPLVVVPTDLLSHRLVDKETA